MLQLQRSIIFNRHINACSVILYLIASVDSLCLCSFLDSWQTITSGQVNYVEGQFEDDFTTFNLSRWLPSGSYSDGTSNSKTSTPWGSMSQGPNQDHCPSAGMIQHEVEIDAIKSQSMSCEVSFPLTLCLAIAFTVTLAHHVEMQYCRSVLMISMIQLNFLTSFF
jgi:hypothetical protein